MNWRYDLNLSLKTSLISEFSLRKSSSQAFQIWSNLVNGGLEDPLFPGLDFFAKELTEATSDELRMKFSDTVLKRDQEMGAGIFIDSLTCKEDLNQERLDRISGYLRFVVTNKNATICSAFAKICSTISFWSAAKRHIHHMVLRRQGQGTYWGEGVANF